MLLAHRRFGESPRVKLKTKYIPPWTHHLKTLLRAFSSIPLFSLSEYFLSILFHKLQSLRTWFHFLLAPEKERKTGKTPHVTKHTESKVGERERWTQCRPKSLPLPLGVASSRAVQLPNLKSLLVFRSPVEWGGGSTLAAICSLVHPLLPVGPQQGATSPPPALVSSSVKCTW